jgi:hypothetical protein
LKVISETENILAAKKSTKIKHDDSAILKMKAEKRK